MAARDQDAKCISLRVWEDIRRAWQDYVPPYSSPWPIPQQELADLSSLREELKNFTSDHRRNVDIETIEHDIDGLRPAVLHEATTLLHKAGNVLRAMEVEGCNGYPTWSRSTAYHSAFFAMRGVLGILGVVVVNSDDRRRSFQIDIWAPRRQRVRSPSSSYFAIRITPRRSVLHKEMWSLFTRVLRSKKIGLDVWPSAGNDILKQHAPGQFSILRHRLHYRSTGWIYADLWDDSEEHDFSRLANDVLEVKYLGQPNDDSFPPSLALHIFSLGMALLSDLGNEVPSVRAEVERAERLMTNTAWSCANAFRAKR
jgi:hypothetical protein